MPTLRVTVDTTQAVAGIHELQKSQLPFAMAKTLTRCAQDGQTAARARIQQRFTLRNNWTVDRTLYKPADKRSGRIEAMVFTDTQNRRTGAPDYMGRQETGGIKIPYGGKPYLAVPTKYLRQMAPRIIPAELRPQNLLGAVGGRYTVFKGKGRQIALRNQKLVNGFEFFVQTLKNGKPAIMGRYFTDRQAYPFYLLIPEATVPPRADLKPTIEAKVQESFPVRWAEVWREIMVRGLRLRA